MFLFAVIIKLLAFLSSVAMFLVPRSHKAGFMMLTALCGPHLHDVKEIAYYIVKGIGNFSMLFIGYLAVSKQRYLRSLTGG